MASTSEVGHAKNVAHLATLITYCTSYGSNYVLLDAGFSIDNNSKVEIDVERCLNSSGIHYIGAPAP
jgi:hypothetical protein